MLDFKRIVQKLNSIEKLANKNNITDGDLVLVYSLLEKMGTDLASWAKEQKEITQVNALRRMEDKLSK